MLGREWHRDTAYGVAARGYVRSGRSDDEWISSHLELRGADGELLSGYGWVFPLGAAAGEVNIGVGTLATARRPAGVQLKALLEIYADARREEWQLDGPVRAPASALLPMGGAVSGVAGRNWALIGDAAGCVNPLNGEGIDYGLETGRGVVELFDEDDWSQAWPATLRRHYGEAFSIARRLAGLLTVPRLLPAAGPVGMRSRALMTVALRVMGNLVTEEDRDAVARAVAARPGGCRSGSTTDRRSRPELALSRTPSEEGRVVHREVDGDVVADRRDDGHRVEDLVVAERARPRVGLLDRRRRRRRPCRARRRRPAAPAR